MWSGPGGVAARFRPAGSAWQAPVQLAACGSGARVAFDAGGNATVAWLECENGIGARVTTAVRHVDGSWGTTAALSTPGRVAGYLRLHVAASGAAVASWAESDDRVFVVQASTRAPVSETWTRAVQLSTVGADAYESSAAVDGTGDVVVGWTRGDPAGPIVWTAYKPSFGSWQPAVNMSPPGDYAVEITVAIRTGGEAVAVWEQSGEGRYAVRSAATGAWSHPAVFPSNYAHDLVVGGAGDVLAVWDDRSGISASEMPTSTTSWAPPFKIATLDDVASYDVGFDRNRGLVAVWGTWSASGQGLVMASHRGAGATDWDLPVTQAVDGSFANDYEAGYAFDESGNVVATYIGPNFASVGAVVLDAVAPQIKSASYRPSGRVGRKLRFAAEPFDISPVSLRWYFGDRHHATGLSVTHVYRKGGRYAITLVATDAAGHAVTVARTSVRIRR